VRGSRLSVVTRAETRKHLGLWLEQEVGSSGSTEVCDRVVSKREREGLERIEREWFEELTIQWMSS